MVTAKKNVAIPVWETISSQFQALNLVAPYFLGKDCGLAEVGQGIG